MNANGQINFELEAANSSFVRDSHRRSLSPSPYGEEPHYLSPSPRRGEGRGEGVPCLPGIASAFIMLLVVAFSFIPLAHATAYDQIHLRDGEILEGRVITEQRGAYLVQPADTTMAGQLQIPKEAVKYVLFADSETAQHHLGLSSATQLGDDAEPATATILPTQAFGEAIVEAVGDASESIWITVFYISGSQTGAIGQFYNALRDKARSGVDVTIIAEFGGGTRPAIRHATLNFATELERDGIEVLFIQEHRSMHKKMIIVDEQTVLLGSSNLTLAGISHSNEMNVRIDSKSFVRAAVEDFGRLQERAMPASEVK